MASQGPNNPGTVVNLATVGTVYWSNPTYAQASDNYDASATSSSGTVPTTVYLKATNFGFSIPSGVTINGIKVEIEKQCSQQDAMRHTSDSEVKIVDHYGNIGTTNKKSGAYWPSTDTPVSYGGATDLWGKSWTPANINDADFGMVISALLVNLDGSVTANIDHIKITVYYTPLTNIRINIGDVWKIATKVQINIGDVWKNVTKVQINIGDVWKTVFG